MAIKWNQQNVIKKFQEAMLSWHIDPPVPPTLPEAPGPEDATEIPKTETGDRIKEKM